MYKTSLLNSIGSEHFGPAVPPVPAHYKSEGGDKPRPLLWETLIRFRGGEPPPLLFHFKYVESGQTLPKHVHGHRTATCGKTIRSRAEE